MPTYTAISTFQHPDGVVLDGETIDLSEADAAQGLDAGALVLTPVAEQPTPPAEDEPPAPTPEPPAPAEVPAPQQSDPKE